MKKISILILLLSVGLLPFYSRAQADEIAQLALNIEKLAQFKQMLSDMKKGYQILEGGYRTIKDISKGNFDIHKKFLDGLLDVSPTVRNYRRIGDIINMELIIVRESKFYRDRFNSDGNFSADDVKQIAKVYNNLLKQSLRNLEELMNVITAGKMRMSDDERLKTIDSIYLDMQDKVGFLRTYNNENKALGIQRAKEKGEVEKIRKLYGID